MTTQLPTWHNEPVSPSGSMASTSSRRSQDSGDPGASPDPTGPDTDTDRGHRYGAERRHVASHAAEPTGTYPAADGTPGAGAFGAGPRGAGPTGAEPPADEGRPTRHVTRLTAADLRAADRFADRPGAGGPADQRPPVHPEERAPQAHEAGSGDRVGELPRRTVDRSTEPPTDRSTAAQPAARSGDSPARPGDGPARTGDITAQPGDGAAPSGATRGTPGTVIGSRYELRTAIGHGGMGTVWRATDTLLRRDVAVKEVLLPAGMATSDRDAMYQRTMREARAAAALSHPAVVQVYDVVTEGGRPWIVMELLQARSLAEIIVEDGPMAPRAVAKIGIALLGALEVAHAARVLHRDVKPANVLICVDGRCVLTDFGVARMPSDSQLTTPGMVLGSPHFISPERAIGAPFGPPSDLFSLGVTLYTAVEGRPPFDRPDPIETMRAVVEEQPAQTIRAGALTEVLYGLLEKDPAERWDVPTARGVLRDLLAHSLASNAPAHQTDPYAVVRPTPYTPPTAPAKPTTESGQIGGRAMLAPGESLTGAIRRRQVTTPRPPAQRSPVQQPVDATAESTALAETGAFSPPPAYQAAPMGNVYGAPAGSGPGGRHAAGGAERTVPLQRGAALATATEGVRQASGRAVAKLRALPPKGKVAVAAGAAVGVLLLGVLGVALLGGPGTPKTAPTGPATDPNRPLLANVQAYADKGLTVNLPAGWRESQPANGTYVDYTDPADGGRRARVNVEKAGTQDAHAVAASASRGLANPGRCAAPYHEVHITDLQMAGHPAAELEYTCGTGATMRHGLWRFVVADGRSYNFFVSVPDDEFAQSKVIYDEMVRSFRLTG